MLEEYDKIDTITRSDTDGIQLVVMDAGLTEDSGAIEAFFWIRVDDIRSWQPAGGVEREKDKLRLVSGWAESGESRASAGHVARLSKVELTGARLDIGMSSYFPGVIEVFG